MTHASPRKTFVLGDIGSLDRVTRDREQKFLRDIIIDLLARVSTPIIQGTVKTTDATQATLVNTPIHEDSAHLITATIVARRTGGSAGTAGDSAAYVLRALYNNPGGAGAAIVGSISTDFSEEDQAAWDATLDTDGDDARVRVTGAADNDVKWYAELRIADV